MTEDGQIFVLEVNSLPGLHELSYLPRIAAHAGLDYAALVEAILQRAALYSQGRAGVKHTLPTTPSARTRSARAWGTRLLVFILLLGGLWIVGGQLLRFVADQPYFALRHVVVHTDGRLLQADIRRWSGLHVGMSVFEVDRRQVETRLLDQARNPSGPGRTPTA